jgi:hypothetical protein
VSNNKVLPFRTLASVAIPLILQAQNAVPRPEFTAYQIGPTRGWLWPGQMFSIYGKNLGPAESCVRDAGDFRPEGHNPPEKLAQVERVLPTQLCGVQLLIDEEPVPLIYVHEKQINFVVPGSRPFRDRVVLRVVSGGVTSLPISVKFGPEHMWLYQEQAASTGMPVWVRLYNVSEGKRPVELPFGIAVLFPSSQCPHIEVKFDGVLLPENQMKNPPRGIVYSGRPCPGPPVPDRQSLAGRIPLHLRYRMDRAGTYFARYVPGRDVLGANPTTGETDWIPVVVNPGTEEQRRRWLFAQAKAAPTDHEQLLYDFLPSIFGYGDSETLTIALSYLYSGDESIKGATAGYLRSYYAASELIPALRQVERKRGKSRVLEQLLNDIGGNNMPPK